MKKKTEDGVNVSDAAIEQRIRQLAVLDWAQTPGKRIREDLGLSYQTLQAYRGNPIYQETLDSLRKEWESEMLRLPSTMELKKRIQHGMALSLDVLIDILAKAENTNKDKISAARLMAQLDGRFLKAGDDGEGSGSKDVESVAHELITAMKRQGGAIN